MNQNSKCWNLIGKKIVSNFGQVGQVQSKTALTLMNKGWLFHLAFRSIHRIEESIKYEPIWVLNLWISYLIKCPSIKFLPNCALNVCFCVQWTKVAPWMPPIEWVSIKCLLIDSFNSCDHFQLIWKLHFQIVFNGWTLKASFAQMALLVVIGM